MQIIDEERFAADGFAKVEAVVARQVADAARDLLWRQIGLSPGEPSGWREPVVWASDMTGAGPFGEIMNSPRLHAAYDAVAGPGGWLPRGSLGMIPVRFPRLPPADDRGWHIDLNTQRPDGTWGTSARSQTMLLLILLSEVGPDDAPTRVRAGSHRDAFAVLGEEALEHTEAGPLVEAASRERPVVHATGEPGDVYLLHPYTVHAADEHRGTRPRFMSQGPVMLKRAVTGQSDTLLDRALR
ncbi:phytanoyl-CoA dioxygenase family protein [Nonomuraea typhae]|uniref:phytanoyl-CoA dioxygenase family protein n=1 Tax=Nonomuraea typhae TaxID=2603600 RepID=UPI0012FCB2A0|nr:phytanoyl-CoA dioxygenase family protein [Nonomuraea typhae]